MNSPIPFFRLVLIVTIISMISPSCEMAMASSPAVGMQRSPGMTGARANFPKQTSITRHSGGFQNDRSSTRVYPGASQLHRSGPHSVPSYGSHSSGYSNGRIQGHHASGYGGHHTPSNGHRHGHGGGQLTISPYGIGYTNARRNFQINIDVPRYGRSYAGAPRYSGAQNYPPANYYPPNYSPDAYGGVNANYLGGAADVYSRSIYNRPSFRATSAPSEYGRRETAGGRRGEPSLRFPAIPTSAAAIRLQQKAERAFRMGKYLEAADWVRQAMIIDSENGQLNLFASQTSLAVGDFARAINELEQATRILPADQWNTVVGNFDEFYGRNDYVAQIEKLSAYIESHPQDDSALVLRGYHYNGLGYPDAATQDFRRALVLKPDNELAMRLMPPVGKSLAPTPIKVEPPSPRTITPNSNELPAPRALEEIPSSPASIPAPPSSNRPLPVLTGPGETADRR